MDIDKIKEIIDFLSKNKELKEVEVEYDGLRVYINKYDSGYGNLNNVVTNQNAKIDEDVFIVKSPMVGIFYGKPNPDSKPFIKVGDKVKKGDTLCLLEAMKIFNNLESEVDGEVSKILVNDSEPIQYDQPLFWIKIKPN